MLLTLKPSAQNRIKGHHEYSIVRQSVPTLRSSPPAVAVLDASATATSPKSAPDHSIESSRRGLPPPSSINLQPEVDRSNMAPMSQLPPAPPGWSSPEAVCQWLQAKTEEERRRQEEEKTRQESLRLEQRKIEQNMLRDSLQSGVPPQMIPLIFARISGGSLPQSAIELIQQHAFQNPSTRNNAPAPTPHPSAPPLHQQQPSTLDLPPPPSLSQRHPPLAILPDIRRDSRILPPNPYASLPPQQQPIPGPVLSQPLTTHGRSPSNQSFGRPPLSSGPVNATASPLSRINGETHLQQVPLTLSNAQYATGSSVPQSQPAGVKQEQPRHSPPSLYFHHWVPPGQPPSAKNQHDSPVISIAPSQRRYEYQSPPGRKRKSQIPHRPAPLPSSRASDAPSSVPSSRPGSPIASNQPPDPRDHYRQRSDASNSLDSQIQDHREANQDNDPLNQKPGASSLNQLSGDLSPTKDLNGEDIPSAGAGVRYRPSHMSDNVSNSSIAEDAPASSSQP